MTWPAVPGLVPGADHNPEQWPHDVWAQDRPLMTEARFSPATVAVAVVREHWDPES